MYSNLGYRKAGWINNQSTRGTYEQILHIRRLFARSMRWGERGEAKAYARMLESYRINEGEIYFKAIESHINAKRGG